MLLVDVKYKKLALSICTLLLFPTLCSSVYINEARAEASASTNVNINFTLNQSLSATLSSNDIYIHDITPGATRTSNTVILSIESNNPTGYIVSASTNSNTSDLTGVGTNNKFTSIDDDADLDVLTLDNTWGYSIKASTFTGNGTSVAKTGDPGAWSHYNGLTTTSSPIFSTSIATLLNLNFRIAAKASDSIDPGEYTNTINFSIVANAAPVTFEDAFSSAAASDPSITRLNGFYKMQDMSSSICSSVTTPLDPSGSDAITTQLIDIRDNSIYHVGKLMDGKCWLLDNLALDLTDSNVQSTMLDETNTKTNASYTSLTYLFGINSRDPNTDPDGKYATAGVVLNKNLNYSVPHITIDNKDMVPSDTLSQAGGWKNGILYNFCTASAGAYCYGNDTSYGISYDNPDSAIDADEDICPSNWRMPTGGAIDTSVSGTNSGAGEYSNLAKAITGNASSFNGNPAYTNFRNAGRFPLSGYTSGNDVGSVHGRGSLGYFWSSTRVDDYTVRFIYMTTESILPRSSGRRGNGSSVRCIAK
ncbi:hypothetical protein IKG28_00290 [Candidatus Saccharibacteria bacterium]|nr:hypothetical protein [Candidatus Saccharibacteria bacterium]